MFKKNKLLPTSIIPLLLSKEEKKGIGLVIKSILSPEFMKNLIDDKVKKMKIVFLDENDEVISETILGDGSK